MSLCPAPPGCAEICSRREGRQQEREEQTGKILSWLEVDILPSDIVAALAVPVGQVKMNRGR